MKTDLYSNLQKKLISVILVVSLAPLLLLGITIYYQFAGMYRNKVQEQLLYRARAQAEAIDLFLKERTAILAAMADTHTFEQMIEEKNLESTFSVMNSRAGAFVDLGVINNAGQQVSYVGPYELRGLDYYQQEWFGEVMSRGLYISDVYLGYRKLPHFIIAVRRQEGQNPWILRATIDPAVFGALVRGAQLGKTGDAFIVNEAGIYQTRPRFGGQILTGSGLDPRLFGGSADSSMELKSTEGGSMLYAGSWLKEHKWLLLIRQDAAEEMGGLFTTRNVEVAIILCGVLAIVLATVLTTRLTVTRLQESERRLNRLNAQLVQSDKLAAIGKMAAGVAHEINNPLAVILQKTGWMEDLLQTEDLKESENLEEFRSSLRKVEEHVERARKVVHNMLGYARRMEPRLEDVDINNTLMQTISLLDNFARNNNITIRPELAADLPIVASDQSQLQQVFLNLISNAIDAIGKGGAIRIRSARLNGEIHVSITDNGVGIPEDALKKVFDPFYTTKQNGKGTGLGLWISYNIIEKMGGTITLVSKEGEGTTFTVKLPMIVPEKK